MSSTTDRRRSLVLVFCYGILHFYLFPCLSGSSSRLFSLFACGLCFLVFLLARSLSVCCDGRASQVYHKHQYATQISPPWEENTAASQIARNSKSSMQMFYFFDFALRRSFFAFISTLVSHSQLTWCLSSWSVRVTKRKLAKVSLIKVSINTLGNLHTPSSRWKKKLWEDGKRKCGGVWCGNKEKDFEVGFKSPKWLWCEIETLRALITTKC